MSKQAGAKHQATGARIRLVRETILGLRSQTKFGMLFGVTKQTVSAWETGKALPREHLGQIAEMGSRSVDWLLTGQESNRAAQTASAIPYIGKGRLIPKMGKTERTIAAQKRLEPQELVQSHFPCSPAAFALQVVGTSMEPDFHEGDILVIDPAVEPRPGDFVWVELKDEPHVLFRRYRPLTFCKGKPRTVELLPSNRHWPDTTINLKTQGKIVGVLIESARQWARRP